MSESREKKNKPPTKLAGGRFETEKKLGAGCFGEVYRGKDKDNNGMQVAIKFEPKACKSAPQLEHEVEVLRLLNPPGGANPPQGVVECLHYAVEGQYNCMVMEILGMSLEDHMTKEKEKKFTPKTTALIAEQVISRIEFLHSKGMVHRDIKPENFMFGVGQKVHHVYIIDFGLSKRYWNKTKDAHETPKQKLSLTGTARYASINAHKGHEQSRRDDIEAIGHMLLYFLRGSLPWSGLDAKTQEEKYRKICQKKEDTRLDELCKDFPDEFRAYLAYARNLKFEERPDYDKLYDSMRKIRTLSSGTVKDCDYQWFDNEDWNAKPPLTELRARQKLPQPDDKEQPAGGGKGCCAIQ
mmetsp:Transcript_63364/g.100421  ORF Transcript_63364/g.100421 Transcript_63364/m.100421 type:complete len:353 (-) Transcript_63364:495-1553(-)|eukprot:CAMPEP_0169101606 /NCGR_PEP_ID=MMETSP1015-20121227/21720_1 /TAXON_ID=342587 /ORGANISM="Karlodinium micrum, Strain CCMP2283" /LENGTH=352 /DNA_ID=CAMNT_0009162645 /DNA_START=60 /DNA_END=1118 /DNA_ORIENTATION=+